jgi:hypothetical protein
MELFPFSAQAGYNGKYITKDSNDFLQDSGEYKFKYVSEYGLI